MPWGYASSPKTDSKWEQMKSCLRIEVFRELPDRSNIDKPLRMRLLGSSKSFLPLHWLPGCRFHRLHNYKTVGFQYYDRPRVKGFRISQIKMPQSLLFIEEGGHLKKNTPWMIERFSLISRVLESWFWQFFSSLLIAFMKDQIFRGPYSTIPEVIL